MFLNTASVSTSILMLTRCQLKDYFNGHYAVFFELVHFNST